MIIEKILNVLIIVCTISAVIGIMQFFGLNYEHGIKWGIPTKLPEKTDIYSTYGNPNFMSSFLSAVFPLVLVNLWHSFNDTKKRTLYSISALIILFCILISRTKSAWGGVVLSIILLFIFIIRAVKKQIPPHPPLRKGGNNKFPFSKEGWSDFKKYLKVSGIIFLAIIAIITGISLILPVESNPIIAELSLLTPGNITFKGRELMWQTTFNMIKDHPLIGLGVNTFRLNYQNYQGDFLNRHSEYIPYLGSAESPHNQFLEIASEQGIIGLLLFIWINITFFRSGNKALKSELHLREKTIAIAIMAGISTILVHAFVEFPLNLVPNAMLYYLYLGFLMIIVNRQEGRINKTASKFSFAFSKYFSFLIIAISAFLCLFFLYYAFCPVIASKIHKDTWYLMRDKRWEDVIKHANSGAGWDKLNDELHLFLGVANYQLGNYSGSLKEYEKAYELYPDYMIPYNIGLIHKKMGNLPLAEKYFKKTIFLRPNLPDPYAQLSEVYKNMGKIDESIEILNKGARYRRF